jgi:RHS repeat-associated protein
VQTETGQSDSNDFTYTGHERDQATGLIYAKARYYDPQLGLFLSRDPFEGYDNTPLSLQRYLYAYQNPMKYVDPDGREAVPQSVSRSVINHLLPAANDAWFSKVIKGGAEKVSSRVAAGRGNPIVALAALTVGLGGDVSNAYGKYQQKQENERFTQQLVADNAAILGMQECQCTTAAGANALEHQRSRQQFYDNNQGILDARGGSQGFTTTRSGPNSTSVVLESKNEIGSVVVSNTVKSPSVIDYSRGFERDLSNFKSGHELLEGPLNRDLTLVSYHADVPLGDGRSAKWWTSTDQANKMSTIDDVHQGLALPYEWGVRDTVSMIKIPKGTDITAYKGQASPQLDKTGELFQGDATQYRFEEFDPNWIIDSKRLE